jgi:hypothetical protein
MDTARLAAEFYKSKKGCVLDINVIQNGARTPINSHAVADKRAARKLAAELGATPWNF